MTFLTGIVIVAAVATVADLTWFGPAVRDSVTASLVHGAVLLGAAGGVIGTARGRMLRGVPVGVLAGFLVALSYSAVVALSAGQTGGAAVVVAWALTWLCLAALEGRVLHAPATRAWSSVVTRWLVAAAMGGAVLFLVKGSIWGTPPEGERSYLVLFFAWAGVWAPGLFVLTTGRVPELARVANISGLETRAFGDLPAGDDPPVEEGEISPQEVMQRIDRGERLNILDVRFEGEFAAGHVPGAINVPFMQVSSKMEYVPGTPAEDLIVYCGHGPRAYMAANALRRGGRSKIVYMTGHWSSWHAAGLRVER